MVVVAEAQGVGWSGKAANAPLEAQARRSASSAGENAVGTAVEEAAPGAGWLGTVVSVP